MINFGSGFVSSPARKWSDTRKELINELRVKYPDDEAMVTSMVRTYEDENPYPYASVEVVVDHIDRVVQLTSIDHVGLGSDYEGVGADDAAGSGGCFKISNHRPGTLGSWLFSRGHFESLGRKLYACVV